jgi:hypothetical protein
VTAHLLQLITDVCSAGPELEKHIDQLRKYMNLHHFAGSLEDTSAFFSEQEEKRFNSGEKSINIQ